MSLSFMNSYPSPLFICVVHYDPGCGPWNRWLKTGWWRILPFQSLTLWNGPLQTPNLSRFWYYYAQADDGAYWAGADPYALITGDRFDQCWDDESGDTWRQGLRALDVNGFDDLTVSLTPNPADIGFRMQYQQMDNWCWIAVATSISHYYDRGSAWTQCSLATDQYLASAALGMSGQCCPDQGLIASVSGLAQSLADPYASAAHNALDILVPRLPATPVGICNHSGSVWKALTGTGNFAGSEDTSWLTLDNIAAELNQGRPIAVDIKWNGSIDEHTVVIGGVSGSTLVIHDPSAGKSSIDYASFPGSYGSGASLLPGGISRTRPA
jgi:uncharacterized membrane protein